MILPGAGQFGSGAKYITNKAIVRAAAARGTARSNWRKAKDAIADQAGAIHAKWAQKANWGDPVIRAKLAGAYATGGDDDEKARILGMGLGSARLAKNGTWLVPLQVGEETQ
jgi:hypothetical protein